MNITQYGGKKTDIDLAQTYCWIRSHFLEDSSVSLPKQEVYEDYKRFCLSSKFDALCVADFGKAMKHVFPSVKPRRLGQRGNSKYCYSGLKKNFNIDILQNTIQRIPFKLKLEEDDGQDDYDDEDSCSIIAVDRSHKVASDGLNTTQAAYDVIKEYAEKISDLSFDSPKDLAEHLIKSNAVDPKTIAAATLLRSASSSSSESNSRRPSGSSSSGTKSRNSSGDRSLLTPRLSNMTMIPQSKVPVSVTYKKSPISGPLTPASSTGGLTPVPCSPRNLIMITKPLASASIKNFPPYGPPLMVRRNTNMSLNQGMKRVACSTSNTPLLRSPVHMNDFEMIDGEFVKRRHSLSIHSLSSENNNLMVQQSNQMISNVPESMARQQQQQMASRAGAYMSNCIKNIPFDKPTAGAGSNNVQMNDTMLSDEAIGELEKSAFLDYFSEEASTSGHSNNSQLSQLRKLLEKNLPSQKSTEDVLNMMSSYTTFWQQFWSRDRNAIDSDDFRTDYSVLQLASRQPECQETSFEFPAHFIDG